MKLQSRLEANADIYSKMEEYGLEELTLSLDFIGTAQRKIQNRIISQQTYRILIDRVSYLW